MEVPGTLPLGELRAHTLETFPMGAPTLGGFPLGPPTLEVLLGVFIGVLLKLPGAVLLGAGLLGAVLLGAVFLGMLFNPALETLPEVCMTLEFGLPSLGTETELLSTFIVLLGI